MQKIVINLFWKLKINYYNVNVRSMAYMFGICQPLLRSQQSLSLLLYLGVLRYSESDCRKCAKVISISTNLLVWNHVYYWIYKSQGICWLYKCVVALLVPLTVRHLRLVESLHRLQRKLLHLLVVCLSANDHISGHPNVSKLNMHARHTCTFSGVPSANRMAAVTSSGCNFGSAAYAGVVRNTLRKSVSTMPGLMLCEEEKNETEQTEQITKLNKQHKFKMRTEHRSPSLWRWPGGIAAPVAPSAPELTARIWTPDRRWTAARAHRGCDDPECCRMLGTATPKTKTHDKRETDISNRSDALQKDPQRGSV